MSDTGKNIVSLVSSGPSDSPDVVLRAAEGEFESVLILGFDHDGCLDCRASTNVSRERILWLIETFKHRYLLELED